MKKYVNDVYITGLGAVTPFGHSLDSIFNAMLEEEIVNNGGHNIIAQSVEKSKSSETNFYDMCEEALERAVEDYGGSQKLPLGITLVLGSGLGLTDALGEKNVESKTYLSELEIRLKEKFPFIGRVIYISNACAASSQAICFGADNIGYGRESIVIAGGVDIYSNIAKAGFERLCALDKTGCHPFDEKRNGISVGQGATFFVMNSKISGRSYGKILGYGSTNDALDAVRMDVQGVQIKRAMEQAISMGDIEKHQIDAIIAHGTGTRLNDMVEAEQIQRFFEECRKVPYVTAPKGMLGHAGGASGALGLLCALGIFKCGIIPATPGLLNIDKSISIPVVYKECIHKNVDYLLINCFAFGGSNVVILAGR